ncbi:hypothetical protein HCN44_009579 [Aphidius gifuensis]|uniref:Methylcrotonoyl-CoA carboxylase subunit alpha, mitochondrial n=1 Tax=Aphidius gifuensis TaxID=684658 RepID=A0A834Y4Y7_APHGI|nr:methylcrotonoyl-CoA carboxylase subunit alpha, mitochondrial [Aphidius gifuensis]KAF7998181.1 hypothetical protein HCN44_009579 [Aphidius gifuensis]
MYLNISKCLIKKSCLAICRQQSTNVFPKKRINKVLIANRGEIACRIFKTAKKLGVKTVAVYSDADKNSMHVNLADEAYYIGPSASNSSYLRQDKIITIAKKSQCQAIHPGYGFLSENMEFAELCQREKIIFIGPPASAIRDMGIKSTSKEIMSNAGVPIIEGYHSSDQSNHVLLNEAKKIGFPVMIKAVRGGGGKGMRIANEEKEFIESLESARTESQKSFGDSDVLLEKYVKNPRHIEVQIFTDMHDNAVYLFERDCSIQRRHQKVIEEAPAPGLTDKIRCEIGEAAVKAAKAVNYIGAGTVEFIFDKNNNKFYFMEMNTRLQVEHPVTEAITGLDLVEWQINIAAGEKLPLQQNDIKINGHAFEARIYAEDPRNGFLPRAGPLLHLKAPESSNNVRIETGVRQGDDVTVYYDPMIAKLVVWGNNREQALGIMQQKLSDYHIAGVETNIEFIKDLCRHEKFKSGDVHTGFIDENLDALFPKLYVPHGVLSEAILGLILIADYHSIKSGINTQYPLNPFRTELGFRLNHKLIKKFELLFNDEKYIVVVKYEKPDLFMMRINDLGPWKEVSGKLSPNDDNSFELETEIDQIIKKSKIFKTNNDIHVFTNDRSWHLKIPEPDYIKILKNQDKNGIGAAVSPMPGIVDKIFVKKNAHVNKGDSLIVIVAMKMEHVIKAPASGIVDDIMCSVGDTVPKDKLLIKITDNDK